MEPGRCIAIAEKMRSRGFRWLLMNHYEAVKDVYLYKQDNLLAEIYDGEQIPNNISEVVKKKQEYLRGV